MFETENRDGIIVLQMQHGKANAMDLAFCRQFVAALEELDAPSTKALVITGVGTIFSAGVDLPRLLEGGAAYISEFLPALNEFFAAVFAFPKPVVAAINGHAIAGGCVLACACDRRIMVDGDGRIGVPELLVGVPFPAEALEIMREAVPPQRFAELLESGSLHDTESALEHGLIDNVAAQEQFPEPAIRVAQEMASIRPELFSLTKMQIRQPAMERIELARSHTDEVKKMWMAPETLAGIGQYVENTFKPKK
jgi:enoyl-CoA hydratase